MELTFTTATGTSISYHTYEHIHRDVISGWPITSIARLEEPDADSAVFDFTETYAQSLLEERYELRQNDDGTFSYQGKFSAETGLYFYDTFELAKIQ